MCKNQRDGGRILLKPKRNEHKKTVDYQCNKVTKICFRNKRRSILEAFLSVFIIHIHIDRFLIQHGFDSVTVFSACFFFFYKNNNKK